LPLFPAQKLWWQCSDCRKPNFLRLFFVTPLSKKIFLNEKDSFSNIDEKKLG
jgi:hypothetical protein